MDLVHKEQKWIARIQALHSSVRDTGPQSKGHSTYFTKVTHHELFVSNDGDGRVAQMFMYSFF